MKIIINRTPSDPPARDYSNRNSPEARRERTRASEALMSLERGQSAAFTGDGVTRDRINGFLAILQRQNHPAAFATANIPGGIGVWRVA